MSIPDAINGTYELCGGFFLLANCFKLLKDKEVKGISIASSAFFTSWGVWNLWYYPHLNQHFSFLGGILIVLANAWWVYLAIYYSRKKRLAKPVSS
jgi:uncharacterized membrane protein YfcA